MAVKTKAKAKTAAKAKSKAAAKPKAVVKKSTAKAKASPSKKMEKTQPAKLLAAKSQPAPQTTTAAAESKSAQEKNITHVIKRPFIPLIEKRRPVLKQPIQRNTQFNFMKAPDAEHVFEVGDTVEVFCDHEKNRGRIRGWVKGIIVQVDHKLAAVQFRSNVYLTDGWMVPDRILWFPINSEHIRPVAGAKKSTDKKDFIPDY